MPANEFYPEPVKCTSYIHVVFENFELCHPTDRHNHLKFGGHDMDQSPIEINYRNWEVIPSIKRNREIRKKSVVYRKIPWSVIETCYNVWLMDNLPLNICFHR
jgi:hypothetical protein